MDSLSNTAGTHKVKEAPQRDEAASERMEKRPRPLFFSIVTEADDDDVWPHRIWTGGSSS